MISHASNRSKVLQSLNALMDRRYDLNDYNCYDFARDGWLILTGVDIGKRSSGLLSVMRQYQKKGDLARLIEAPSSECLFVGKNKAELPHIGIIMDGYAFHLPDGGARHEPLSHLRLEKIEFYENFAGH